MPDDGKKYVEQWRRDNIDLLYLKRGWKRVEEEGIEAQWLDGVETEEQWAAVMLRLNEWQQAWETKHNIPFVHDVDLM